MQSYRSLRLVGAIALILFTNFASAESASQYALYLSDDHAHSRSRSDLGLPVESRINAIAASAESLIAGTDAGLFVSTNGVQPSPLNSARYLLCMGNIVLSMDLSLSLQPSH